MDSRFTNYGADEFGPQDAPKPLEIKDGPRGEVLEIRLDGGAIRMTRELANGTRERLLDTTNTKNPMRSAIDANGMN
jgi:hypothetical protein